MKSVPEISTRMLQEETQERGAETGDDRTTTRTRGGNETNNRRDQSSTETRNDMWRARSDQAQRPGIQSFSLLLQAAPPSAGGCAAASAGGRGLRPRMGDAQDPRSRGAIPNIRISVLAAAPTPSTRQGGRLRRIIGYGLSPVSTRLPLSIQLVMRLAGTMTMVRGSSGLIPR